MRPAAFALGVITGAAALALAAILDSKKSSFSNDLKKSQELDCAKLADELNHYFFAAQKLYARCNEIVMDGAGLMAQVLPLPWDSPWQKLGNLAGAKLGNFCRKNRFSQLVELKAESENLYQRYLEVFRSAATLVEEAGGEPGHIAPVLYEKCDQDAVRADDPEKWGDQFEALAHEIRNGIEKSCSMVEELIDALENYLGEQENACETA